MSRNDLFWRLNLPLGADFSPRQRERLEIDFQTAIGRFVRAQHEAMAYVTQSPAKTGGADGRTAGTINGSVDLSAYGFDDVHSAEYLFTTQKTKPFYNRILEEFDPHIHSMKTHRLCWIAGGAFPIAVVALYWWLQPPSPQPPSAGHLPGTATLPLASAPPPG